MNRCRCPVGKILGSCPFSYANGWHERRGEMLLRTEITPDVQRSIDDERARRLRDPSLAEQLQYPDIM